MRLLTLADALQPQSQESSLGTTAAKSNYCSNRYRNMATLRAYSSKVDTVVDQKLSTMQELLYSMELLEVTLLCTEGTFFKIESLACQIIRTRASSLIHPTRTGKALPPVSQISQVRSSNKTNKQRLR